MKLSGLTSGAQGTYLEAVKALLKHYNRRPDEINEQQIREHLAENARCCNYTPGFTLYANPPP